MPVGARPRTGARPRSSRNRSAAGGRDRRRRGCGQRRHSLEPRQPARGARGRRARRRRDDRPRRLRARHLTCDGRAFPDLVAPGTDVRTADYGASWQTVSGTSVAAPHVAGALALVLARHPGLTADEQANALLSTAYPLPGPGAGAGRVDALAAFESALPAPRDTTAPVFASLAVTPAVSNGQTSPALTATVTDAVPGAQVTRAGRGCLTRPGRRTGDTRRRRTRRHRGGGHRSASARGRAAHRRAGRHRRQRQRVPTAGGRLHDRQRRPPAVRLRRRARRRRARRCDGARRGCQRDHGGRVDLRYRHRRRRGVRRAGRGRRHPRRRQRLGRRCARDRSPRSRRRRQLERVASSPRRHRPDASQRGLRARPRRHLGGSRRRSHDARRGALGPVGARCAAARTAAYLDDATPIAERSLDVSFLLRPSSLHGTVRVLELLATSGAPVASIDVRPGRRSRRRPLADAASRHRTAGAASAARSRDARRQRPAHASGRRGRIRRSDPPRRGARRPRRARDSTSSSCCAPARRSRSRRARAAADPRRSPA